VDWNGAGRERKEVNEKGGTQERLEECGRKKKEAES